MLSGGASADRMRGWDAIGAAPPRERFSRLNILLDSNIALGGDNSVG